MKTILKKTGFIGYLLLSSVLLGVNINLSAQDSLLVSDTLSLSDTILIDNYIPAVNTSRLSIVFAGDIMGHDTQIEGAYVDSSQSYDYEPTFRYISDFIDSADIAVGNLEVTLAGPPYKGYPQFSSPDELAIQAGKAGFDILVNANNHALDRGEKGFLRTIEMLDSLQFLRAGTYRDSLEREALHPLIFEKNNIRVALLNYTYGTNGLKIGKPRQINRIDTAMISYELEKAKLAEPDFTVVCIHWGTEYQRDENSTQMKLAEFIYKHGADAIIGSHPHVIQPIKYIHSSNKADSIPVVFSMGNFVSNQRAQYKDGGIMPALYLNKTNNEVQIDSLTYLPYWVWRQDNENEKSTFYVVPVSRYEQAPEEFKFTPSDEYRLKRFANDTRDHLKTATESSFYIKPKKADPVESASENLLEE